MGTEVARRTPMQQVLETYSDEKFVAKVAAALPEDVSPQQFVSVTLTAIRRTPELITAEPDSLYTAILRCAQDGLMPDGREAALVIFKEQGTPKAQYMPMIGGIRKVAAEDGFTLNAHVVYENDQFDYELGARAWVKHKPAPLGTDRGQARGAYATAADANGQLVADPEVMDVAQIEHVRSKSKQKDGHAWKNDWPEMARKTVARRLFKSLPRGRQVSERVDRVIRAVDEEFEFPPDAAPMSEDEANLVAGARALPSGIEDERVQLRDEPTDRPADDQLNRIAALQGDVGEAGALMTLRGVFGVETVEELTPEDATRYEQMLRGALKETGTVEGEVVGDGAGGPGSEFEQFVPKESKA